MYDICVQFKDPFKDTTDVGLKTAKFHLNWRQQPHVVLIVTAFCERGETSKCDSVKIMSRGHVSKRQFWANTQYTHSSVFIHYSDIRSASLRVVSSLHVGHVPWFVFDIVWIRAAVWFNKSFWAASGVICVSLIASSHRANYFSIVLWSCNSQRWVTQCIERISARHQSLSFVILCRGEVLHEQQLLCSDCPTHRIRQSWIDLK